MIHLRNRPRKRAGRWGGVLPLLLIWAMTLVPGRVVGQSNHIRLLNGAAYVDQNTVSTNAGRLATELPGEDIRITYVTNYVGASNRYEEYTSQTLPNFALVPYGAATPLTAAEQDAALNDAIHHAMTTAQGVSGNTIHIIYATVSSLNRQGHADVKTRKYIDYGPNVKPRTKQIVKQIKPDEEVDPEAGTPDNVQPVSDYVDEIIDAINDPNYVINGSVRYDNEIYFSGDTLYYFHRPNELITGTVSGQQQLELLENTKYPIQQKSWLERTNVPGAGPMLVGNGTSGVANLRLRAEHFNGDAELQVRYDGEVGIFYFMPVNLRMELQDSSAVESRTPISNRVTLTNNGNPFNQYGGFTMKISAYKENTSTGNLTSPIINTTFADGSLPTELIPYPSNACGQVRFEGKLYFGSNQALIRRRFDQRVKCPFDLEGLRIVAQNTGERSQNNDRVGYSYRDTRTDSFFPGDTLYLVSYPDSMTRHVTVRTNYFDRQPGVDDFWGPESSDPATAGVEGDWDFGSSSMTGLSVDLSDYHHRTNFDVEFTAAAYAPERPGTFIRDGLTQSYNPYNSNAMDHGEVDIQTYPFSLSAFDANTTAYVSLIRRHRTEAVFQPHIMANIGSNDPIWTDAPAFAYVATALSSFQAQLDNFLSAVADGPTKAAWLAKFRPVLGYKTTYDQLEQRDDKGYFNVREKEYEIALDYNFDEYAIPGLSRGLWLGTFGVFVKPGFKVGFKNQLNDRRPYDGGNWQLTQTTLTGGGGLNGTISVGFKMDDQYQGQFAIDAFGSLTVGFSLEMTSTTNNLNPTAPKTVTVDGVLDPGTLTGRLVLTFGNRGSAYNWTAVDQTYTWTIWQARRANIATFTW